MHGMIGCFCVFVVVLCVDVLTKAWAARFLPLAGETAPSFFSLSLHHNYGLSFSLFSDHPTIALLISAAAFCCLAAACAKLRLHRRAPYTCALLCAGAIGNLLDRVFRGYVVDWIYFVKYINIADISLCLGCLLAFKSYYHHTTGRR